MTEIMSKAAKTLCRPSLLENCLAGSAQCPVRGKYIHVRIFCAKCCFP